MGSDDPQMRGVDGVGKVDLTLMGERLGMVSQDDSAEVLSCKGFEAKSNLRCSRDRR